MAIPIAPPPPAALTLATTVWGIPHVRRAIVSSATGSAVGKILGLSRETFDEAAPVVYGVFEHRRLKRLRASTVDYDRYRFYLSLVHTVKHTPVSPAETFDIFATYPRLSMLYDNLPGRASSFAVLYWGSDDDGTVGVEVVVDGGGFPEAEGELGGVRAEIEAFIPERWAILPRNESAEASGRIRQVVSLKRRDTPPFRRKGR